MDQYQEVLHRVNRYWTPEDWAEMLNDNYKDGIGAKDWLKHIQKIDQIPIFESDEDKNSKVSIVQEVSSASPKPYILVEAVNEHAAWRKIRQLQRDRIPLFRKPGAASHRKEQVLTKWIAPGTCVAARLENSRLQLKDSSTGRVIAEVTGQSKTKRGRMVGTKSSHHRRKYRCK